MDCNLYNVTRVWISGNPSLQKCCQLLDVAAINQSPNQISTGHSPSTWKTQVDMLAGGLIDFINFIGGIASLRLSIQGGQQA